MKAKKTVTKVLEVGQEILICIDGDGTTLTGFFQGFGTLANGRTGAIVLFDFGDGENAIDIVGLAAIIKF